MASPRKQTAPEGCFVFEEDQKSVKAFAPAQGTKHQTEQSFSSIDTSTYLVAGPTTAYQANDNK